MNKIISVTLLGALALVTGSVSSARCAEPAPASAVSPSDPQSYDKAIELYRRAEYNQSAAILESRLKENPGDVKAKNLLSEVLIAASVEDYLLGSEEASYQTLSRALQLAPNLDAANRMYEKIRSERFSRQDGAPKAASTLPADAVQFQELVSKMVQGQKELLTQNHRSLEQIIEQTGSEKKEILKSLEKREDIVVREIQYGRKASAWFVAAAIFGILLIVASVLFIVQRISSRREKLLIEQGEKFIQLVQDQSKQNLEYMKEGLKEGLENISISVNAPALPAPGAQGQGAPSQALPYNDDTASKLRKIDIIDAEIVLEGKAPMSKDQDVLHTLLEDPDPAVRARTIQVLFKTNPDEAYSRVQEMLTNPLISIRLTAIRLMTGMATSRSAEILINQLNEQDPSVKREAIAALKSLLSENISDALKQTINRALSDVSKKEGWIIK